MIAEIADNQTDSARVEPLGGGEVAGKLRSKLPVKER
jgi:hypothetical protein